jgi:hypothetical protein
VESAGPIDLEATLRVLLVERDTERQRLSERIRSLGEKERRAVSRLDALRRQLAEARGDLDRVDRHCRRRQRMAVEEALRKVAADLANPARGSWGDDVVLVASHRRTRQGRDELLVLLPVDPRVVEDWESHAESAPLRIAMVAYATLVTLAAEHGVADKPTRGTWGLYLAFRLDLGPLQASRGRAFEPVDAEILLEEHPRPWAAGGRERTPRLTWVPAELLDDPGFAPAGRVEP